jgi:Tol biopolymer transport system component
MLDAGDAVTVRTRSEMKAGTDFSEQSDGRRWSRARWVTAVVSSAGLAAALAIPAHAAFPGQNGVIAYFWPDPEADLGYLAFAQPDGSVVPRWVARWRDSEVSDLTFSPDGLRAAGAFEGHGENAIAVAQAPSMRLRAITRPRSADLDRFPSWSPDGSSVVFQRHDGHENALLYTARVGGSRSRPLVRGESAAWSTLGRIAFVRYRHDGARSSIYLVNESGRGLRRLTHGRYDQSPDWSPDGQRLAFERGGAIYTVGADGSGLRRLTFGRQAVREPAFSPDGTQIVSTTGRKLVLIPAQGGASRELRCEEPDCFDPAWLPASD